MPVDWSNRYPAPDYPIETERERLQWVLWVLASETPDRGHSIEHTLHTMWGFDQEANTDLWEELRFLLSNHPTYKDPYVVEIAELYSDLVEKEGFWWFDPELWRS